MDLPIVEELKSAGLIRGKKKLSEAFYNAGTDGGGGGTERTSVDTGFQFAAPMGGKSGSPDDGKRNELRPGDVKDLFEVCHTAMKGSRAALSLCMKIQGNKTIETNRAAFAEIIKRIESDMDFMSKVISDPDLLKAQGDSTSKASPMSGDAAQNGQQQATNQAQGGNAQAGAPGGGGGGEGDE